MKHRYIDDQPPAVLSGKRLPADLNSPANRGGLATTDEVGTLSGHVRTVVGHRGIGYWPRSSLILGLGLLWICAQIDCRPGESMIQTGDVFPDLGKFAIEGTLPETLKGKVVVVDFWASWCGPCKESFSVMEELHRRFNQRGLVILAVNVDESRGAMEEFLKEHPVTFNVVRDSKKALARALNFQSMPTSFILDADGRVHSIYHGFHTAETRRSYVREIKQLLKLDASNCPPASP